VDIADRWEFMALLGESSDVILEGFTWILPATLQVLGVTRSHIRALEVFGDNLLDILPAIDCIPW
jgi:hypothetical protein